MNNIICVWAGPIAEIPAGWVLCDGNNSTPDLRDRFLLGAGSTYAPDATLVTNVAAGAAITAYALAYIMKSP